MSRLPALLKLTTLCATLLLGACAGLMRAAPPIGAPLADVTARLGQPSTRYPAPDGGQLLEYASGPFGQTTWMAQIGNDGRLRSYEQVLTGEKFATIKIDQADKASVLRTIGRPAEVSRVHAHNYEVWSYRYKEAGVWNSLMHVHFDEAGIVRQLLNGPDPLFDVRDRFSW